MGKFAVHTKRQQGVISQDKIRSTLLLRVDKVNTTQLEDNMKDFPMTKEVEFKESDGSKSMISIPEQNDKVISHASNLTHPKTIQDYHNLLREINKDEQLKHKQVQKKKPNSGKAWKIARQQKEEDMLCENSDSISSDY